MADTEVKIDRSGNLTTNLLLNTKLFIPQARHPQDVLSRPRLVDCRANIWYQPVAAGPRQP